MRAPKKEKKILPQPAGFPDSSSTSPLLAALHRLLHAHRAAFRQERTFRRMQALLLRSTRVLYVPRAFFFSPGSRLPAICRHFYGALGRTRTCDLLSHSQTHSRTGGRQGGTRGDKTALLSESSTSKGTGRDMGLWYEPCLEPVQAQVYTRHGQNLISSVK
jgi:hypothetical protein